MSVESQWWWVTVRGGEEELLLLLLPLPLLQLPLLLPTTAGAQVQHITSRNMCST
jgi:hypothetical protein